MAQFTEEMPTLSDAVNIRSIKKVNINDTQHCTYSAMAMHCQKVETPWTTVTASMSRPRNGRDEATVIVDEYNNDERGGDEIDGKEVGEPNKSKKTSLGDVIAQALSQKLEKATNEKSQNRSNAGVNQQATSANNANRKKKNKKGISIYMSGMQFNPNN